MRALTVFIADDHDLFRSGLVRAISAHDGLELVGEAADGTTAFEAIQRLEPDLALLDRRMPGMDGLGIVRALHAAGQTNTRSLILTADVTPELVENGARDGAAGVVSKAESRATICDALMAAAHDHLPEPPAAPDRP